MYTTCHACNGCGYIILKDSKGNEIDAQKCPVCLGEGRIYKQDYAPYQPWTPYIDPCPKPWNPYPSCPDFVWVSTNDNNFTLIY